MPYPSRRFSPSLDSNVSVQLSPGRPSLYDNKDDFIERVAPIGMAAIYFGSFSFAPQDAALSRQALFKLSFAHRYFLQPAGLKIAVLRQTAILSGNLTGNRLRELADILARQIEGVEEVKDETETAAGNRAKRCAKRPNFFLPPTRRFVPAFSSARKTAGWCSRAKSVPPPKKAGPSNSPPPPGRIPIRG